MADMELKLGAKIGAGAFGEVFEGADPVHGQVAVKVFRRNHPVAESDSDWDDRKAALLNEGQKLSQADHANVVRVHYLVEADGGASVRLVMRRCAGCLQADFERGPMTLSEARKVATDIAFGLQALHARGMLHRDIKPGNLLTENGTTKLGDFGLVTDKLILGYASQAGYRDHLAVEVWHGEGTSKRSDIWALGMTIYRLLHGQEWYSQYVKPRYTIANGGFADSLKWLPHVPKRWRTVIRKMMADDPKDRYQNCEQLLAALGTLTTGMDWSCAVSGHVITWKTQRSGRSMTVTWEKHSTFKYSWRAESAPLNGVGRTRTLDGSGGQTSFVDSEKKLRTYFKAR